jgi:hypothetical protein
MTSLCTVVVLGLLFHIPGEFAYLGFAASLILISGILLGPVPLSLALMLSAFAGPDIASYEALESTEIESLVGSPWRLGVGPLTPGMIQFVLYFALFLRIRAFRLLPGTKWFIIYAFLTGFAGLSGRLLTENELGVPISVVISDIRMICFFLIASMIWHRVARVHSKNLHLFCQVLFFALLFRVIWDALMLVIGLGPYLSGAPRGGLDSTKWTVLLFVFWGLYNAISRKRLVVSTILLGLSAALSLAYMTRMIYLAGIVGLMVFVIQVSKVRLVAVGVPLLTLVCLGGFFVMREAMPDSMEIYLSRAKRLGPLLKGDFETADQLRVEQFINCFGEMGRDGTIVFGRGFGGYYGDTIRPMPAVLTDAFAEWVEDSRRFPRIHNNFGHFVLKFGLVGAGFWIIVWIGLFRGLWRKRMLPKEWEMVRVILLSMGPAVFFLGYWSSKGMILTGFYMALSRWLSVERKGQVNLRPYHR